MAWESPVSAPVPERSFSRGFSVGWLHGGDHKAFVPGKSSAKRGVLIGTVGEVDDDAQKGRSSCSASHESRSSKT